AGPHRPEEDQSGEAAQLRHGPVAVLQHRAPEDDPRGVTDDAPQGHAAGEPEGEGNHDQGEGGAAEDPPQGRSGAAVEGGQGDHRNPRVFPAEPGSGPSTSKWSATPVPFRGKPDEEWTILE